MENTDICDSIHEKEAEMAALKAVLIQGKVWKKLLLFQHRKKRSPGFLYIFKIIGFDIIKDYRDSPPSFFILWLKFVDAV